MVTQNLSFCNNYTDLANPRAQSTKYTAMTLKEVHIGTTVWCPDVNHSKMIYLSLLHKIKHRKQHTGFPGSSRLRSHYLRNRHGYYSEIALNIFLEWFRRINFIFLSIERSPTPVRLKIINTESIISLFSLTTKSLDEWIKMDKSEH